MTGATGLLGKCVLERLLRLSLDSKKKSIEIFLLVRPKRSQTPEQRVSSLLSSSPIFDGLRAAYPLSFTQAASNVKTIKGDVLVDGLNVSPSDKSVLFSKKDLRIVHCAASVDFDAPIVEAAEINVRAPLRVFDFCVSAKATALVHVSTAYVNANKLTDQREGERRSTRLTLPSSPKV